MTGEGDTLLRAQRLRKSFGGHAVLHDVSFRLRLGDVVVLRGENGSGKTTLLNILTGNLPPDAGSLDVTVLGGRRSFRWPTHWLRKLDPRGHFTPERLCQAGVGRVWQDIRLFSTLAVTDNVVLASPNPNGEHPFLVLVRRRDAMRSEARHRLEANERLRLLGMQSKQTASCDQLSLGQMKRVAIARAVQTGARVILLDEPLAGLDGDGQREVLRYVREIAEAGDHAIVLVEHLFNLPKILELATHVWTLRQGRVEIEEPRRVRRELDGDDGGVGATVEALRSLSGGAKGARLEARGLVVRRGLRRVLDGYDFFVGEGDIVPLAHPNGWGKTTLFDALAGLIPVDAGQVLLDGQEILPLRASERVHRGLSYLRAVDNVVPGLTVAEHFALARDHTTIGDRFEAWRALLPPPDKPAALLSGGERQRLAIASLPIGSVMLFDEPFLNLDAPSIRMLFEIFAQLGCTRAVAFPTPDLA